jgi:hypothetical protein
MGYRTGREEEEEVVVVAGMDRSVFRSSRRCNVHIVLRLLLGDIETFVDACCGLWLDFTSCVAAQQLEGCTTPLRAKNIHI